MIEYIYDVIRASSGQPFTVAATLTKEDNTPITTPCELHIFKEEEMIITAPGAYLGEGLWQFEVAAELTEGRKGKHWYCIGNEGVSLCFRKPLYLV